MPFATVLLVSHFDRLCVMSLLFAILRAMDENERMSIWADRNLRECAVRVEASKQYRFVAHGMYASCIFSEISAELLLCNSDLAAFQQLFVS